MNTQVPENPVKKNRDGFSALTVIAALMVTSYLTANIMAVKLVGVFGVAAVDAGTIIFPLAFMLGDVLTEIWGFKVARKVIFLTFICNLVLILVTTIGVLIPTPDYLAGMGGAYDRVFTYVPRIVAGSLAAFLCGELINSWLMVKIKERTGERRLWIRTVGSSAVGYLLDSAIFCFIAYAGTVALRDLWIMIGVLYIIKLAIEAVCGTPACYAVIAFLRKRL